LRTLLTLKSCTRTHAFLSNLPILDRIDEYHNPAGQLGRVVAAEVWS
jgi:hypothetical protein